jgi:biopolymer transport protein ExbB/TolQ
MKKMGKRTVVITALLMIGIFAALPAFAASKYFRTDVKAAQQKSDTTKGGRGPANPFE